MTYRAVVCLKTLIDLVLPYCWDGDHENFEQQEQAIRKIRELINTGKLTICIPLFLFPIVHLSLAKRFSRELINEVIYQLHSIGLVNVSVDSDRILEQAQSIVSKCTGIELYEALILATAYTLRVDAIIMRQPYLFERVLGILSDSDLAEPIPIVKAETFVKMELEHQSSDVNNEVVVFTPQLGMITLPMNATPIDFAYKIHTDIGDQCHKAFVNEVEVSLDTPLKNGDIVAIERKDKAEPNPNWLNFVVTNHAKKAIQRGLKRCRIRLGWERIKQELGGEVRAYKQKLDIVAKAHSYSTNELIIQVGSGELSIEQLREYIQQCDYQPVDPQVLNSENNDKIWRLASCCQPLPGDEIVGVASPNNNTIRVHQTSCQNLSSINSDRLFPISWKYECCSIQLSIVANDQIDIIRPILNNLVESLIVPYFRSLNVTSDGKAIASLVVEVSSRQQLDLVLERIKDMPTVTHVNVTKIEPVVTE